MSKQENGRGKLKIILPIVIMIVVGLFFSLIDFITDFLWFKEIGYISVFFTKLFSQLKIATPSFIAITLFAFIYLSILKRGYYKKIPSLDVPSTRVVRGLTLLLSAGFGLFLSLTLASKMWFEILQFVNSSSFDIKDPLFKNDVSFYIFKMPFLTSLNGMGMAIVLAFIALTVIYYLMLISLRRPQIFETVEPEEQPFDEENYDEQPFGNDPFSAFFKTVNDTINGKHIKRTLKPKKSFSNDTFSQLMHLAGRQIAVLGALFFLMVGANFAIRQFSLLYSGTGGVVYGAGYVDVNITLWMYRVLIALSALAAIIFFTGISRKNYRVILTVPVLMIVISFAGTGLAGVVQNVVVSPDEINKESKYLKNNIKYTQMAYNLQNVEVKNFKASNTLSKEDIANNLETISNIRINDYEPAEKFYGQTQSIRRYYSFNDVDVDRYMVNGEYTQTFLAAREVMEGEINQTWINQHLKYTHGYGITLSRVDKVTASGQPDMLISGIPPISSVEEIQIQRPEIYFGESTNNYILVNTDEEEFDYPDGDSNKYTKYQGTAGIKLNPLNRLIFAIRERSLKLLVSTNINNDSRIVINRNIENRVKKIMPYLVYDQDPYIVVADGKLYWMIDAYTVSNRYPYSMAFSEEGFNYIRNSVKVVIDAYNGDTSFYIVGDADPIAETYAKIYPKLFKNVTDMPESLQSHIRYPNKLFNIQANIYKRYHMNDVKVFYQDEDLWDVANEIYGTDEIVSTPNYYIMKLPGEKNAEFVNTIPYTPKNKRNMTGLFLARNDGEHYGKLVLYQLPKDKSIYGPMQIEAQIDQNTEISKEFSLWNSSGSNYSRGNLFVIPIEQSLLYVEPVYLEATKESIPEVKRVIVAYGDKIAYKETLAEALDYLFGENSTGQADVNTPSKADTETHVTASDLIQKANEAYEAAQSSLKNGDWAGYGEHMTELRKYLTLLSGDEAAQGNTTEE